QPLVCALVDRLEAAGIPAFGPSLAAARLEGSKAFMKEFCTRHAIPTACFRRFAAQELGAARDYIRSKGAPLVIKADGLAAGKGVVVAPTVDEAEATATASLKDAKFGAAGETIVIADYLEREAGGVVALCYGTRA